MKIIFNILLSKKEDIYFISYKVIFQSNKTKNSHIILSFHLKIMIWTLFKFISSSATYSHLNFFISKYYFCNSFLTHILRIDPPYKTYYLKLITRYFCINIFISYKNITTHTYVYTSFVTVYLYLHLFNRIFRPIPQILRGLVRNSASSAIHVIVALNEHEGQQCEADTVYSAWIVETSLIYEP